jgi:chemotaxis protein MotB
VEAALAEQQRRYEAALLSQQEAYHSLMANLQGEIARKDVTIREFTDRLAINIVDRVLFPSGQASLTTEGKRILDTIGQVLAKVTDRRVQIEGHTDAQEIGPELKKLFASNWELSAARATEVVRYLLAHTTIPAEHLLAAGRADTVPVASNTTEAGRRLNRRIEILLLPLTQPIQAEHGATGRPG